jgi:hypothetical protein
MRAVIMLCAALVPAVLSSVPASAASLFWSKFAVQTNGEGGCYTLARGAARDLALQGVRVTPNLEVAGSKDGVYISITCVGRIAIVMAMADNQNSAISLRDGIANNMKRARIID